MEKRVSVVMCTYNGEKYLKEQIESILNQTYPVYEIIIQDDCSIDHTMDILQKYEKEYTCIHAFRNEKQKGISENFFSALDRANGDYIALSDQDDIWEINKIERQISYADDYMLVACVSKPFATDDEIKVIFDERERNTHLEREIYLNSIPGHTMLFKKSLIDKIPDATYRNKHFMYDYLIALVAAANQSIYVIPQILVNHRRLLHSATYSVPDNYKKTLPNIFRFTVRTFVRYCKLHSKMRIYFSRLYRLLEAIDAPLEAKKNAMALARYHSQNSLTGYIGLTILCVRLRKILFYAEEKNAVLSILRAIYFPISCSEYFIFL